MEGEGRGSGGFRKKEEVVGLTDWIPSCAYPIPHKRVQIVSRGVRIQSGLISIHCIISTDSLLFYVLSRRISSVGNFIPFLLTSVPSYTLTGRGVVFFIKEDGKERIYHGKA